LPNLGTDNVSYTQVQTPPYLGFIDFECNLLLKLRRDDDEQSFWQELMVQKLDWLMDSGSEDPQ